MPPAQQLLFARVLLPERHEVSRTQLPQRLLCPAGDCLGGLWAHGPQVLHGHGPDRAGGAGPVQPRGWVVQTLPHLLAGRLQHRTSDSPPLPVLPGELHQPFLPLGSLMGEAWRGKRDILTSHNCSWIVVNIPFLVGCFFPPFFPLGFVLRSPRSKPALHLLLPEEQGPRSSETGGGRSKKPSPQSEADQGLLLPTHPKTVSTAHPSVPAARNRKASLLGSGSIFS